ncbi:hypothetical protein BTJ39_22610 [Izhakiella australiensis]|uniref:DUF2525 domain-containing protein n=1 Tax=Izhakiella australiensis TaxID=1926881 RepID=A0A1S8Y945_9GAMM|nr:DUF2525 domain-containing protein [Izhakiella australiensis]OON35580.1 hypothetical protein BTJ39_22610 [Izhakiella australiensis]
MSTANEYHDNVQREVNIDVEALLEAVHARSGFDVREFVENEHQHRVLVDGKAYDSYADLADAFELDIRDYAISEVNR